MKGVLLPSAVVVTLCCGFSHGAVTLHIYQDGSKVTIRSAGGTVDTTGLNRDGPVTGVRNSMWLGLSGVEAGVQGDERIDRYDFSQSQVIRIPSAGWTYTPGESNQPVTFSDGATSIAVQAYGDDTVIYLPSGSVSGVNVVPAFEATTLVDTTLSALGYASNQHVTYSWSADSITVWTTPVPEPGPGVLLAFGLSACLWRRKQPVRLRNRGSSAAVGSTRSGGGMSFRIGMTDLRTSRVAP